MHVVFLLLFALILSPPYPFASLIPSVRLVIPLCLFHFLINRLPRQLSHLIILVIITKSSHPHQTFATPASTSLLLLKRRSAFFFSLISSFDDAVSSHRLSHTYTNQNGRNIFKKKSTTTRKRKKDTKSGEKIPKAKNTESKRE